MKKIRDAVLAAGGVENYIGTLKAGVQVDKIRTPTRQAHPRDTVLGFATDEMKTLVGVRRQLRAMMIPFENVVEEANRRLQGAIGVAKADTTLMAFITAVKDPGFEEAIRRRGEVSMDLSVLKILRDHVTNMITLALLVQYTPEIVKSGKPTFDQDWRVVIPAKRTPGTEGLPPEVSAIISRLAAERGADSVQVVDVSGGGDISEILSRIRAR